MNQQGSEAVYHNSVNDDASQGESCARNDMVKQVEGESHATSNKEKELDVGMESKSYASDDIQQDLYFAVKDGFRVTNDTEQHVDVDMDVNFHASNDLEKGLDRELEGDSHASNDSGKELDDRVVPKIGMAFDTVQEAYNYYNSYARRIGFSVRKQRTNKCRSNPAKIQLQTLCCSCEGFYDEIRAPKRRREHKRFGCKAMFEVHLTDENNYVLTKFTAEHNHELVSPENFHMLRSQRKVDPLDVGFVNAVNSSRLQQSEIFSYMGEGASQNQKHSSIHCDSINLEVKKHVELLKRGEAQCLLDYFKQKKQENKHYFYSFWTNEDFEIRGIFFCDGKSRRDYSLFGDALYFDTTFRTNDCNMVCALILGVNSHGQTTLFGCCLLEDETTDAIVWLFTTFLEAMGGRKPKTIFTNQSMESAIAIGIVFPETHHRLYLWHIYRNVVKHLDEEFIKVSSISERFKECIYDAETVEEFEKSWELLFKDFGLKDNEWLQGLYMLRQKWAQVYDHVHFCACMTTTQMSESVHKYLTSLFGSVLTLRQFVDQCASAMIMQHEMEMEAENDTKQKKPFLYSNWSIEHEASQKYTHKMFCLFQDEYKKTPNHRLHLERDDGTICTYKVIEIENKRRSHTLIYNRSEQSVACTCRKFEFHGIICSHVLKVFNDLEFTTLPSQYYLKRWTRDATDEFVFDSYGDAILSNINPLSSSHYSELSYISQKIVMKGAKSSTMYSLAKSVMLELEAKVEAFLISAEEERSASKKNISATHENLASNSNNSVPVRNKKTKRSRGQPKNKFKSVVTEAPKAMISAEQIDKEGENVTNPDMIGGGSAFYHPIQEPFGFMNHLLHGQDQNQVPQWPATYLPYNFMGCPEQSNISFFTSDYLFMSQQASIAQTQEPQEVIGRLDLPCSSASYFPDPSMS